MPPNRNIQVRKALRSVALVLLAWIIPHEASALETPLSSNPPERCAGYGNLQSRSLTDWEAGLGTWSVGTRSVFNPATFDTPNWAVVGSLPDARSGQAAFVPNLDIGNCGDDDETGVLYLESPPIVIPGGTQVPRISVDHWFDTEFGNDGNYLYYADGGNFKISVNGGAFDLIPASAIELAPYNDTLSLFLDPDSFVNNTNPLAGQNAFTGRFDSQPTGSWVQSRINLLGIAAADDTVELRFEFGIDCSDGAIGWYVDNVEFYSCEAELPPSDCGNGVIDPLEQCDDGNDFIGDGCSNTCQVEDGWQCAAPTSPGTIADPSFEDGWPNQFWTEVSNNSRGTPICDAATCNTGGGSGPSDGTYWVWIGGTTSFREASVSQSIVIPSTVSQLTFDLEIPVCDSASDFFEVLIDGNQELRIDGADPRCGTIGYATQSVDISAYADDLAHDLKIHGVTIAENGRVSNFFIDVVTLPGSPSFCRREGTSLTLLKDVINDDGGSALSSAWTLTATGPSTFNGPGPGVSSEPGFLPGSYVLSESSGAPGYSASAWICDGGSLNGNTITLALDETATCTITNDDIPPTLKVVNNIDNGDGGPVTDPDDFGLKIDGITVLHNEVNVVAFGDHIVSANGQTGYAAGTWGGDCNAAGAITLALGQNASCTITHDDIPARLTVVKTVENNSGGDITNPNLFVLRIDTIVVPNNTPIEVSAGTHTVSEDGYPGYQAGPWGDDCAANGLITLALNQDASCTITNDDIPPTLTLVKHLPNDNGGTATQDQFQAYIDGSPVPWDTAIVLDAGVYTASEDNLPGYNASSWSNACAANGVVTLNPGDQLTCEIINNDSAPSLILDKIVVNNNGGTAPESDWTLFANDGPTPIFGPGAPGSTDVQSGANFKAGTYNLSESAGPTGYTAGSWSCVGGDLNGSAITLALGESATCTLTNDDDGVSLILDKIVVNDNGGTAIESEWTLFANDGPTPISGPGAPGSTDVQSGANFKAGTYNLSESAGPAGYTASSWSCVGGDLNGSAITLNLGESATCTLTNDDDTVGLILDKIVVNDNGGTAIESEWTLFANDGPTPISGPGAPGSTDVQSGAEFKAGTYNLSESAGPAGYTAGSWSCVGGDLNGSEITLTLGESATCTLTNDDDGVGLTLNKVVTTDNGGSAVPADWTLSAAGPTPLTGPGPTVSSGASFKAGIYTLSESGGLAGYTASAWVCDGGSLDGDTLTLALGESANCTITNDDQVPNLTLDKIVVNNNGGTAPESDWTLFANDGPTPISGPGTPGSTDVQSGVNFKAGTYNLSESAGPAGYTASSWNCVGGNLNGSAITLAVGEAATCTLINNDDGAGLTLNKVVSNDNGGTAVPADWMLSAAGPTPFSGPGPSVSNPENFEAGSYVLSESPGPTGYTASAWVCDGGSLDGNTITLALGESANCTITNDDDAVGLTLNKVVTNDNGGGAVPADWTLNAAGPTPLNGPGPTVSSSAGFKAGSYVLTESTDTPGYTAGAWVCDGGSLAGNTLTLALGESANCTITNDDQAPSLILDKIVVNNNGGTAPESDWTLFANDGPTPISGPGTPGNTDVQSGATFKAGTYNLSESAGPAGYTAGSWSCVGGDLNGSAITLNLGESATCTLTNDDDGVSLTLDKIVVNNNGGTAPESDWTLFANDGPTPISGPGAPGSTDVQSGANFKAGTYNLSESAGPAGYTASSWSCVGGNLNGSAITLALGESATCTLTNDDDTVGLILDKIMVNDNGGTAIESEWTLFANDGPTPISGPGAPGSTDVQSGANFKAGTYNLSESAGPTGYTAGSWSCVGGNLNGSAITLALGESATCTLTNDDDTVGLTLNKVVTNDNGGTAVPADWTLDAAGPTPLNGPGPTVTSGAGFKAGSYVLSESGIPDGYTASDWACDGGSLDGDTLTLALGESANCTITNDDEVPSLILDKIVVNDNGGTAPESDWTLFANDGPHPISGPGAPGSTDVQSGADFKAGTYNLSESAGPTGYTAGSWSCVGGNLNGSAITLALGESAICTLTNDDDAVSLTLNKMVTNDNGGTAVAADWTLDAAGPTPLNGPGPSVSSPEDFKAGSYVLSESTGPDGYTASDWACDGGSLEGDTLTLALGESASCTITNDDDTVSLILNKVVTNDNGGGAVPADWMLNAAGPTPLMGPGPIVSSGADFEAGSYSLSESTGPIGYTASAWVCDGGSLEGDTLTLALGESANCTITNDDEVPSLILDKIVVNDNGGTAPESDWTVFANDGPTPISGPGAAGSNDVQSSADFKAGTYNLSESAGPAGYTASSWSCVGSSLTGSAITVALGESATCTITNDDDTVSLTLNKVVTNDNGGDAVAADWTLNAAGPTPLSGPGPSVTSPEDFEAGNYVLSENAGPDGYTASAWICDSGSLDGDTITLALGESATCTITNDDQTPSLILDKIVINNNGGTAPESDWTLFANDGPTPISGPGTAGSTDVQSSADFEAGTYNLSESAGPAGYTASSWSCVGGSLNDNAITVALGESATCTITNDDDGLGLTLNKVVTNDNGGEAVPADWTLSATGPTPFSGPGPSVSSPEDFEAGSYVLSESAGADGYTASDWICDGGSLDGDTLIMELGESISCTITNDDDTVSLTLNKVVSNDNGGTAVAADWTLDAAGPTPLNGLGPIVSSPADFEAGSYILSETGGPDGYTASAWICDGGSLDGDTLTLALGESASCTITNDDNGAGLTLIKVVTNDNEGVAVPANWTLSAAGPTPFDGPGPSVSSGDDFEPGSYDLSESDGPNGYIASDWVCDGGSLENDTITLALGESVTCTITNNDDGVSEMIFTNGFE